MSVHVLSWVLKHSPAELGARLVLIVLADKASDDGTGAWPSVETIAREARMHRRTVQRNLRELEEAGMIVTNGVSQYGTVIYDVLIGGGNTPPPPKRGAALRSGGGGAAPPKPSLEQDLDPNGSKSSGEISPESLFSEEATRLCRIFVAASRAHFSDARPIRVSGKMQRAMLALLEQQGRAPAEIEETVGWLYRPGSWWADKTETVEFFVKHYSRIWRSTQDNARNTAHTPVEQHLTGYSDADRARFFRTVKRMGLTPEQFVQKSIEGGS